MQRQAWSHWKILSLPQNIVDVRKCGQHNTAEQRLTPPLTDEQVTLYHLPTGQLRYSAHSVVSLGDSTSHFALNQSTEPRGD